MIRSDCDATPQKATVYKSPSMKEATIAYSVTCDGVRGVDEGGVDGLDEEDMKQAQADGFYREEGGSGGAARGSELTLVGGGDTDHRKRARLD